MSPLAQVRTFFYEKYGFFCLFFASLLFNKFKRLTSKSPSLRRTAIKKEPSGSFQTQYIQHYHKPA
ncbi:hypothetical protein FW758_13795 [Shewanella sp. 1180_01]